MSVETIKCTRKGCEKEFNEIKDSNQECIYHSGAPVFHEGLKGWSCCTKKVVDFEEFLAIPGCTTTKGHSKEEQLKDIKPKFEEDNKVPEATKVTESGKEIYGVEKPKVESEAIKESTKKIVKKETEKDRNDLESSIINEETTCKRPSCGAKYDSKVTRDDNECTFHYGEPVFHEGSKGWSCCKRRVLEFDEFLKIAGCTQGKHRFTDDYKTLLTDNNENELKVEKVECRHDWYQTQKSIIISVFAKKLNKESAKIEFKDSSINVFAEFLDGKVLEFNLDSLFQPILPNESKYEILSTKIEITLVKANGISWAALEKSSSNEQLKSWTTFGTVGGVGTVGGKEAILAKDSPLYAVNK